MPRSRTSRAAVVALTVAAMASPLAAQRATEDVFRSYLGASGSTVAVAALESREPVATSSDARLTDEEAGTTSSQHRLGPNRMYVFGGTAALAVGLVLSQQSSGSASLVAPVNEPALLPNVPTVSAASATDLSAASSAMIVNPEPGTVLLLATGLAGIGVLARRRRA